MASTKGDGPEVRAVQERWRIKAAPWLNGMAPEDRDRLIEFLDAIDPDVYATQPDPLEETKSYSTIYAYGQNLRLLAKAAGKPLTELTTREVNDVFSDMDLAQNTISQRQSAATVFYRYHADLGVDPEIITINRPERSPVEPRDLYTREEVDAMHEAMDNARDRAMIDLMLYTGQRIRAIQTLKVGDMDIDDGRFYLNTDAAGLKGAKGMRPLTVAKDACATWMQNHPASDDEDAYFITKLPDAASGDVHTPLHQSTIGRRIEAIVKEAGIDRWKERRNPHNFRHTFVRWAYVNKDMDIQTIKYMTGHSKDSQTLERTYMNIFESDFATKVEEATGVETKDDAEDHLTPEVCPICNYGPLPQDARACPQCANYLSPEWAEKHDKLQSNVEDLITDVSDTEAKIVQKVLSELRENPDEALNE